jgi:branched-chain amino acid transport system permease protein
MPPHEKVAFGTEAVPERSRDGPSPAAPPAGNPMPQALARPAARAVAAAPHARPLVIGAVLLAAAAAPLVLTNFVIFQLTMVMVYGLAILGLNLLTGFNGQFSLGHSAFFAIGAYTAAILISEANVPYYLTLPCAGVLCFLVGFLFGLPALRLQGLYLALATFALAAALPQILKFQPLEPLTGGVQGIFITKPNAPPGLPLNADQWLYYFTLLVLLVMVWAAANLVNSRTGRAIMAIRDHPIAATAMGIHTARYKTLTFGVSALYTGVAGALGALAVQFVAPDSFDFLLSVLFLVGLVVGGVASIPGSLFGGLFVLFVPNIAERISTGLSGAVYGAILLLAIFVMPSGAAGFARALTRRLMSQASPERGPAIARRAK